MMGDHYHSFYDPGHKHNDAGHTHGYSDYGGTKNKNHIDKS